MSNLYRTKIHGILAFHYASDGSNYKEVDAFIAEHLGRSVEWKTVSPMIACIPQPQGHPRRYIVLHAGETLLFFPDGTWGAMDTRLFYSIFEPFVDTPGGAS